MQVKQYFFVGFLVAAFHWIVAQDLEGTWEMVLYVDISTLAEETINDPENYTITFTDSGTIFSRVDCNDCMGNYFSENNEVSFDSVTCTEMGCGSDSQEEFLMTILSSGGIYKISNDSLGIVDENLTFGAGFILRDPLSISRAPQKYIRYLDVVKVGNKLKIEFPSQWVGADITLYNLGGVLMDRFVYKGKAVEISSNSSILYGISRLNDKTGMFHISAE